MGRFPVSASSLPRRMWTPWRSGRDGRFPEADLSGLVALLRTALHTVDPVTGEHSDRVARYLVRFAEQAEGTLTAERRGELAMAGVLHDIGKAKLPLGLLQNTGRLDRTQVRWMRAHPELGHRLLAQIPALRPILPVIVHHHERYDGSGYPRGLKNDAIPRDARMAAIVDAFDAMTGLRRYRSALPLESALEEIIVHSGSQFDPHLVALFVRDFHHFRRLYQEMLSVQAPVCRRIEAPMRIGPIMSRS